MKAILFHPGGDEAALRDIDTKADAIAASWTDIPGLIENLDRDTGQQ